MLFCSKEQTTKGQVAHGRSRFNLHREHEHGRHEHFDKQTAHDAGSSAELCSNIEGSRKKGTDEGGT